jgi:hypothetical protein
MLCEIAEFVNNVVLAPNKTQTRLTFYSLESTLPLPQSRKLNLWAPHIIIWVVLLVEETKVLL